MTALLCLAGVLAVWLSWLHRRRSLAERFVLCLFWVAVRLSAAAQASDTALVQYRRSREELRGKEHVPACIWREA
jgi:hypothetical protein